MFGREGWGWGGSKSGPESKEPPKAPTKSYYDILGVDRTLEGEEFAAALRKAIADISNAHHPDKHVSSGDKQYHEDVLKAASEAHTVLKDKKRRNGYDAASGLGEEQARAAASRAMNYTDGDALFEQADRTRAEAARNQWRQEKKRKASATGAGGETAAGGEADLGAQFDKRREDRERQEQEARRKRAEAWQAEQNKRQEQEAQAKARAEAERKTREEAEARRRQEQEARRKRAEAWQAEQNKRQEHEAQAKARAEQAEKKHQGERPRPNTQAGGERVENRGGFEVKLKAGKVFYFDSAGGVTGDEGFEDVVKTGPVVYGVRDGKKFYIDSRSGVSVSKGADEIVMENGQVHLKYHPKSKEKVRL